MGILKYETLYRDGNFKIKKFLFDKLSVGDDLINWEMNYDT